MRKEDFFDRETSCYYFDDIDKVAQYCKENHPAEVEDIIRIADNACNQIFTFDSEWDLEQYHEPISFEGEIDWRYKPADDMEFIYQFNRHRYFICLGQAYAITKDEKYAKTFVSHMTHWVDNEPLTGEYSRGTSWRSIEAGFRGEYWSKAIHYFRESPSLSNEAMKKYYDCLIEHGLYIESFDSPHHLISNWSVIENHGLFEIAMTLPQDDQTLRWANLALSRLDKAISFQVMNDGVHWEQSPMYHNEVLHCYQDVILLARRNKIAISENILDKVKKMTYANIAWKKPNHRQIMQGDSDDMDIRNYISVSGYLYKDPMIKSAGFEKLDFESLWDLGIKAAGEYEGIPSKEPDFRSIALNDSGNYYMRGDWSETSNLLHFHCGTLGAGHGHSDKLHIDLVVNGEDVLVDGGRYTYVNKAERGYFKDPEAHNTITVDNKKFTICKDSWECSKLSGPVKQDFYANENYEFVQGGHIGYMDLPNGVFVNRKIVHIKPNIYIIMDEMYTGGDHTYQQYFHFNEIGTLEYLQDIEGVQDISDIEDIQDIQGLDQEDGQENLIKEGVRYLGKVAVADLYFVNPTEKSEIIDTKISRFYNSYEDNKTVKNEFVATGFASAITVIITDHSKNLADMKKVKVSKLDVKSSKKDIVYPDHYAEALKIETKDSKNVVIICHQEVNSPTDLVVADGCAGFGNVIVFEPEKEKIIGSVLNW